MFRPPKTYSPVELDFLKENKNKLPVNQLTIALDKSRTSIQNKILELEGKAPKKAKRNKRSRIGKRDDILVNGKPQFLRSTWEAKACRWLIYKDFQWEYEPEVFYFEGIKSGTTSYTPDFRYGKTGLWLEVKGFLDPRGRAAINRFKKFYPREFAKLRAITGRPTTKASKFFRKLGVPIIGYMADLDKKYSKIIPHWDE